MNQRVNGKKLLLGFGCVVIPFLAYHAYQLASDSRRESLHSDDDTVDGTVGASAERTKQKVAVLYGTCTGNARILAERMCKRINANPLLNHSFEATCTDLKDYNFEDNLQKEDYAFIISATWTDGVAPESAQPFFMWLEEFAHDFRVSKGMLSNVKFACFGLGSAYYEKDYCKFLYPAHEHLEGLGATALHSVKRGDDQSDLEPKFDKWERESFAILRQYCQDKDNESPLHSSSSSERSTASNTGSKKSASFSVVQGTPKTKNKNNGVNSTKPNNSRGQDGGKAGAGAITVRGNDFQKQQQEAFGKHVGGQNKHGKGKSSDIVTGDASSTCGDIKEEGEEGEKEDLDNDELEEEDLINNRFVTMDNEEDGVNENLLPPPDDSDDDDDKDGNSKDKTKKSKSGSDSVLDLEELGPEMSTSAKNKAIEKASKEPLEMVTKLQRKALTKEGYRIIGTHSAVKLCRWTKNQMRGRGGCYKHTFYGITSYQCMEATPSLACANKCVFCWRHHKNPVGTEWRWKEDDPVYIVDEAVSLHQSMINEMRGVPGVKPERLEEGFNVKHCALSLVGEPIMYPRINEMLQQLHIRDISSFLVTNAQFPDEVRALDPVTQLYVSVDASNKESLKAIDRPLFKDYWERFTGALKEMSAKRQRTVYRLTLVDGWNMDELEGYAALIETGLPDFIEIKAVTYCGKSDASSLTMENVPWHKNVVEYGEAIADRINERGNTTVRYSIATEHEHSCCILLAREDRFLIDGVWHTWIDYEKFNRLIREYYVDKEEKAKAKVASLLTAGAGAGNEGGSQENKQSDKDKAAEDKAREEAQALAGGVDVIDPKSKSTPLNGFGKQEQQPLSAPFAFTSEDYMLPTPEWAVFRNKLGTRGFDPEENRWKRNRSGKMVEIEYKSSDSGCG